MIATLSRRLFLMSGAALWWAGGASAAEPLKLGVIASYSGAYADYGKQFDGGMAVYLAETGGTLAGRPVTFVRKDTAGASC